MTRRERPQPTTAAVRGAAVVLGLVIAALLAVLLHELPRVLEMAP